MEILYKLYNKNKILITILIIIMYSYAIERIVLKSFNLTAIFLIVLMSYLIFFVIKNRKILTFNSIDVIMYILIVYSIFNGLINNTIDGSISFIYKSLIFYYIGRYIIILKDDNKYLLNIINMISYVMLANIIINFLTASDVYRISIEGAHPVAIGELISIFIVSNYIYYKDDKKIMYTINSIAGLIIQISILGSRGAFISSILTLGIIEILVYKKYVKVFILSIIICIFYYLFNIYSDIFIQWFPTLSRFTFYNFINDPSIVGGHGNIGRADVMGESITYFNQCPIFGVGFGKTYAHNLELEILANLGVLGLLIFLIIVVFVIIKISNFSKINIMIFGLFIVTFINRQSSFSYDAHKNMFMCLGMLISSSQYYKIRKFDIT